MYKGTEMSKREQIETKVIAVLAELFELDAGEISAASHLYEDLDIDSIDAVDLAVELKRMTGKKIQLEDFKNIRTVSDVVDAIETLMDA